MDGSIGSGQKMVPQKQAPAQTYAHLVFVHERIVQKRAVYAVSGACLRAQEASAL